MARLVWTDAEIEQFLALIEADTPRDIIGETLKKSGPQVTSLYYSLRTKCSVERPLQPASTGGGGRISPMLGHEDAVKALATAGYGARQIAKELNLVPAVVGSYMARNGLFAASQRPRERPPQTLQLQVNLDRVRGGDQTADDVRLAEDAWREFDEKAA